MDLKARVIQSTAWFAVTRMWMQTASWAVTLVLARILTPADYGLFAMAQSVTTLLELLQELGLGTAIIQRQNLTKPQINAIFWIVAGVSLVLTVLSFFIAPVAAWYYEEPRLVWMVRMLGVTFLLNSLGTVPYSLLTKEIDFRRRSLAEAFGVIVSIGASLALAYLSYGVWALVLGQLVRVAVRNVALLLFCGWIPTLNVSFLGVGEAMKFGLRVAGASIAKTSSTLASTLIIGRALGGNSLGLYSMADSLGTSNPIHKFSTSVINQLSLPVFSKLQEDEVELRKYFLKISKYLAMLALPMQVGMTLVAPDLVPVLLSEQWLPIVGLVQAFSLGGIFFILPLPSAPLLTARGKAQKVLRISVVTAGIIIAAYAVGVQFGLLGVAVAWLIAFPVMRLWLLVESLKEIGLSFVTYVKNILCLIAATLTMAVVVLSLRVVFSQLDGPVGRLVLEVSTAVLVYVSVLHITDRGLSTEVRSLVQGILVESRA